MEALRAAARRQRMTVAAYVREALREKQRREINGRAASKMAALRDARHVAAPTADIDEMRAQIARGYAPG